MTMKDKKRNTVEFETKVVERHRRLEEKRDEKEQKQMYDEMQNSFVKNFESGELVH